MPARRSAAASRSASCARRAARSRSTTTETEIVRARIVVGADGSASRVARYVGVRYRVTDLGLEDEIPHRSR